MMELPQILTLTTATLLFSFTPTLLTENSIFSSRLNAQIMETETKQAGMFLNPLFNPGVLLNPGIEQDKITEYQLAIESLQKDLIIYQQIGDRIKEANTLNKIGTIYLKLEEYQKALESHQEALIIYQQIGNFQDEAETLGYIGNAYFKLDQYNQVEKLFRQKLQYLNDKNKQILREVMRRYLYSQWWFQFGYEAKTEDLKLRERLLEGQVSWKEILELSYLNLYLAQELKIPYLEALSLHSMGWANRNLANYQEALKLYEQALSIVVRYKCDSLASCDYPYPILTIENETFFLVDIGIVYADLAQYKKALMVFNQVLNILDSLEEKHSARFLVTHFVLNHIGLIYKNKEDYELALQYFEKALSQLGQGFEHRNILNNMGLVYLEIGNYDKALSVFQEALNLSDILGEPTVPGFTLNNIGLVYTEMGDYTQALESYQKALTIFRELNDRSGEALTYNNLALLLQKQNQPSTAIIFYKESVNIYEQIRHDIEGLPPEQQKSYLSTIEDTYRNLADLLLSQGRILEAQQVLELLKVQEISNYTRSGQVRGGKQETIAINNQEIEVLNTHGTLIALGKKINDCEINNCDDNTYSQLLDDQEIISAEFQQVVNQLEATIKQRRGNDTAFLDPNKITLTSAKIVEAQPDTVLIYPLVLEDKIWILWASSGGITSYFEVENVGKKELSRTVLKLRELLQNPSSDLTELQITAQQLYNWLIPEKLAEELTKNKIKNLVFSLDSVTRYIPIEVLFDGENYLLTNYTISAIISAELTNLDEKFPSNPSILAGGLSVAVEGFNALPNVELELDNIVINSPEDKIGVYQGSTFLNQQFHRQSIRNNLRNHNILHIATHGKFVPGDNKKSYLMLGNGEKYPIPEIENLRGLDKIHLVVLSACETALGGEGNDGTEIAGISYYFLKEGVDTVIASLWQVDDESTSLLMQYFYENLESRMSKAEALRKAKLSLMNGKNNESKIRENRTGITVVYTGEINQDFNPHNLQHPYYWGAFILIGNGL